MCDILIALPDATSNGNTVFAKNSDRPARECQVIQYTDGRIQKTGSEISCSYITLPQSENVLSTIGASPYWCWGYETAINEAGVVGGNTAVFTKHDNKEKTPGLTGMDLLRLGLERGTTAEQAVEVITSLLKVYGQWGSAVQGQNHDQGSYDNAFIIADSSGAWLLETAGRNWVAKQITSGTAALSNQLTIRKTWDLASPDIQKQYAEQPQTSKDMKDFDFALSFSNHEKYPRQVSHIRWMRSRQLLESNKGRINAYSMMDFLRDHYEKTFINGPMFNAFLPDFHTICMHESPANFTWGNTATSFIVELDPKGAEPPSIWFCYLPPCSSFYMNLTFQNDLPAEITRAGAAGTKIHQPENAPADTFHPGSLWWRMQRIYDSVKISPERLYPELRQTFDELENEIKDKAVQIRKELIRDREVAPGFLNEQMNMVNKTLDKTEKRLSLF